MHALRCIVAGVIVLGMAALVVMLGLDLMPARAVATGKGTLIPWLFTWGLIWVSAVCGVVVAIYMFVNATSHPTLH